MLLLILSEVFIVLEAMGFGLAIGNGALSIVLTVVSIAAVAAGYHILSKKLLKPLAEMDEAAVELAAGNLNVDVRHKSEDEMGYLADSFRNLIAGRSRRPHPRQETPEQQFKRMERYCFRVLSDYHNLLRRWKRDYAPKTPEEEWHPLFVEALQKQSHVEYLLDVLLFSDIGERAALIASYGKEVRNLERRMADLAARTAAGRDGHHRSRTPAPER